MAATGTSGTKPSEGVSSLALDMASEPISSLDARKGD